jgi:hypothetical protein
VGVDVDAKREETDALFVRNGKVEMDDDNDWVSTTPLVFGSLRGEEPRGFSDDSKGEALLEGVMKTSG